MAGPGHVTTTRIAIECLPAWQRDIWRSEENAMAETYAWYGDAYYTNRKELGPYVELWDGSTPGPFEGVREKKNYGHEIDYWESFFMDYWEKAMAYYLRRISEWLAAGDVHSAAQCAGTVSHWIADIGFPMHADLPYVRDFFPPPPDIEDPLAHRPSPGCGGRPHFLPAPFLEPHRLARWHRPPARSSGAGRC